jgi:hypothetical protein
MIENRDFEPIRHNYTLTNSSANGIKVRLREEMFVKDGEGIPGLSKVVRSFVWAFVFWGQVWAILGQLNSYH